VYNGIGDCVLIASNKSLCLKQVVFVFLSTHDSFEDDAASNNLIGYHISLSVLKYLASKYTCKQGLNLIFEKLTSSKYINDIVPLLLIDVSLCFTFIVALFDNVLIKFIFELPVKSIILLKCCSINIELLQFPELHEFPVLQFPEFPVVQSLSCDEDDGAVFESFPHPLDL